jgi:subtilisin family serine protease
MPVRRTAALVTALLTTAGLVSTAGFVSTAAVASPATAAGGTARAAAPSIPAALKTYVQADRTSDQWSLASTHASAAWTKATGAGVVVATVDTGADATNPDLAGQLVPGAHANKLGQIVAGSAADTDGHGTHVAGIIVGKADGHGITGIAPGAKVMPINYVSALTTGNTVGAGIRWATDHGAKIVNLSLGEWDIKLNQSDVAPVCAATKYAHDHGVLVVASAGNNGEDLDLPSAPADCGDPISVAALDNTLQTTSWSSFDPSVTLAAPGANIYSTVPTFLSRTRYAVLSGTSMSAPFVAGVAALVLQQHPDWTPDQVKTHLEDTAKDLGPTGFDPRYGYGAVDPAAAVGAVAPAPVATHVLTALATGLPSRFDSNGEPVFDHTLVSWEPDATAQVTGYTVTAYTPKGTTTTNLPGSAVRLVTTVTTGGYVVTAHTSTGDITAPAVWYSTADDASAELTPIHAVQHLKAHFTAKGKLAITWLNPKANKGRVDLVFVVVNDNLSYVHQGKVSDHVTLSGAAVPPGDLAVVVDVVSTQDFSDASAKTKLGARVPLSGSAVRAGYGRYRLTLDLAASWGHRACSLTTCEGVKLYVVSGGKVYAAYLDSNGEAVLTIRNKNHLKVLGVRVRSASHHYHHLDMAKLRLHVGHPATGGGDKSGGGIAFG